MLTSPEIRAELEKAGWVLTFAGSVGVQWDHPKAAVTVLCNGQHCFDGDFTPIFQFCTIAGIAPQGYAIVPVKNEHAKAMVADIASIFEGYDADKVVRELDEFFKEDDEEETQE